MIITAAPNPRFLTKERSSQKKRTIERKKGGKRNKREMEKSGLRTRDASIARSSFLAANAPKGRAEKAAPYSMPPPPPRKGPVPPGRRPLQLPLLLEEEEEARIV